MCDKLLENWWQRCIHRNPVRGGHLIQVIKGDYTNLADVFGFFVDNLGQRVVKERGVISNKNEIIHIIADLTLGIWKEFGYLACVGFCLCLHSNVDIQECLGQAPKQYTFLNKVLNWLGFKWDIAQDGIINNIAGHINAIAERRTLVGERAGKYKGQDIVFYKGKLYFEKLHQWVDIGKVIGIGGCGSVIYECTSSSNKKLAIKQVTEIEEIPNEPENFDFALKPFYESLIDPMSICTEVACVGENKFLRFTVLELGTPICFRKFKIVDVLSVMKDLLRLEDYRKAGVTDHIDFKLMLVHLDIHGGNFINTEKGVRLIDWGLSFVCNQDPASKKWLNQHDNNPPLMATRKTQLFRTSCLEPYIEALLEDWLLGIGISGNVNMQEKCKALMGRYGNNVKRVRNISRQMEQCLRVCHELIYSITCDIIKHEPNIKDIDMGRSDKIYSKIMHDIINYSMANISFKKKFMIVENIMIWYDMLMIACLERRDLTAKDALKFFTRHNH